MNGLVIKKIADKFSIEYNGEIFSCTSRGKNKDKGIFVGDYVEFENGIIEKVCTRKNIIIRPPLANLDRMFIVLASIPKPDYLLLDKLLIFCYLNDIEPIIIVNKIDIDLSCYNYLKSAYSDVKVLKVSAKENDTAEIAENIKGICAFSGQSAVGKSSLINSIFKSNLMATGELSKKVLVGKQTTRSTELFKFKDNDYIADTAGFSKLDENLLNILAEDLFRYYNEYVSLSLNCEYQPCSHIYEKKCGIKDALSLGKIDKDRYNRYVRLYELIKSKRRS